MFDKGKNALQDLGNDAVNAASGAITDALDIKDFYSAHLMTYCEGDFKPDANDPNADEEVTKCSERKAFFAFDPTQIIESKLPKGMGLSDLKWPDELTNGLRAIKAASKAMFFFYTAGIAMAGVSMIGAVFGLLADVPTVALANLVINAVSSPPSCDLVWLGPDEATGSSAFIVSVLALLLPPSSSAGLPMQSTSLANPSDWRQIEAKLSWA